jgi:hypothetical protein
MVRADHAVRIDRSLDPLQKARYGASILGAEIRHLGDG